MNQIQTISPQTISPQTICLTMIIRNESQIIKRCLESVKSICEYMTICDTGSTDNTCKIVTQFFEDNPSIDGRLYHHKWKNFGHNRTLSLDVARKTKATYVLCVDADMVLEIGKGFDKESLNADVYNVNQKNSVIIYPNRRLLKSSLPWKCVGVTHESYDVPKGTPLKIEMLDTLLIQDLNDGGCKADKFERDVKLLTQGLVDEPNNSRYMFYLAESYYNLQQYNESLEWYTKRINAVGYHEEVYFSHYKIGHIMIQTGRPWTDIKTAFLAAYQHTPSRSEPLYELALYCRNNKLFKEGYDFARLGTKIPFPSNLYLFLSYHVYDYLLLGELTVCAYYQTEYKECIQVCKRLLKNAKIPDSDRKIFQHNLYSAAYQLSNQYRNSKLYAKGYKYANLGLEWIDNTDTDMFYKLSIEMAICIYYLGKPRQSIQIYKHLTDNDLVPESDIDLVKSNIKFSVDYLALKSTQPLESKPILLIYLGSSDLLNVGFDLIDLINEFLNYYNVNVFCNQVRDFNSDIKIQHVSSLELFIKLHKIDTLLIFDVTYFSEYLINAHKTFVVLNDKPVPLLMNVVDNINGIIIDSNTDITLTELEKLVISNEIIYRMDYTQQDISLQFMELFE